MRYCTVPNCTEKEKLIFHLFVSVSCFRVLHSETPLSWTRSIPGLPLYRTWPVVLNLLFPQKSSLYIPNMTNLKHEYHVLCISRGSYLTCSAQLSVPCLCPRVLFCSRNVPLMRRIPVHGGLATTQNDTAWPTLPPCHPERRVESLIVYSCRL